jgi:hypothetical protein
LGSASSLTNLIFNQQTYAALKAVEEYYTIHLSTQTYDMIPTDYTRFLHLYNIIHTTMDSISNKSLKLLFKITEEGLNGAINAYGLNYSNTELTLQNAMLQQRIDDILSGKNNKYALDQTRGQLTIQKSFKLAPLFSYYIMLYGMPEPGVGFDQAKLAMLLSILEKNCVDPYK